MKYTSNNRRLPKGFTLAELMVAMSITLVLVLLTLVITGTAIDAWKVARQEIRAAGQAKVMLNALGRDLESLVFRLGNNDNQWLIANTSASPIGPERDPSPNAAKLIFFTSAADRYNGNAGSRERLDNVGAAGNQDEDEGGDVSAVSYQMDFVDPVFGSPNQQFSTFVIYRNLVNPDRTYFSLVGEENLEQVFTTAAGANGLADLICENVYEFTVTFVVNFRNSEGIMETTKIPVMATGAGQRVVRSFAITGAGLVGNNNTQSEYSSGTISAVEISISVLSDEGIAILKRRQFQNETQKAQFLEENSFRYSKSVLMPQG